MPKVLIIDDNPVLRQLVSQDLTSRGYEVIEAGSGKEGLTLIREQTPDLILLDIGMPGMTGWEVLESLREHDDPRKVAVVIVTGRANQETEAQAKGLGALAVLNKPFTSDELDETVRGALRVIEFGKP